MRSKNLPNFGAGSVFVPAPFDEQLSLVLPFSTSESVKCISRWGMSRHRRRLEIALVEFFHDPGQGPIHFHVRMPHGSFAAFPFMCIDSRVFQLTPPSGCFVHDRSNRIQVVDEDSSAKRDGSILIYRCRKAPTLFKSVSDFLTIRQEIEKTVPEVHRICKFYP